MPQGQFWLRRLLLLGALILGGMIFLYTTRYHWMPGIYTYLNVTGTPEKADFIVILGGGDKGGRAAAAAELYRQDYGDRILVSGYFPGLQKDLDALARAGIPADQVIVNSQATNTWNEAQQNIDILLAQHAQSAIIVTDDFHSRRARGAYRQLTAGRPIRLSFAAAGAAFIPQNWWENKSSFVVWREYLKLVYYTLVYGVSWWQ